jgi:carbamoyltransferase
VSASTASIGPRFQRLGAAAFAATYPLARLVGALTRLHSPRGAYAQERIASMRQELERGETVYILGIGAGGHNTGVGLIEASRTRGIRLIANHEEERFRAVKHFQRYPGMSVQVLAEQLKGQGIEPERIHAACASWDYLYWTGRAMESVVQELPGSLRLLTREASPQMNARCVVEAFKAPRRLGRLFNAGRRMPVIGLRHHDNHAWLSWGVSPFAKCDEPVMVLVLDGAGDDGAISTYVAHRGSLRLLYRNDSIWDSLGMMYGIMSSSQGGWPVLSSEGRYMGAAAWGDSNRLTNPYYGQLRQLFVLASNGRIFLNRSLANWQRGGCSAPYTKRLVQMVGEPILPKGMWHPDAVLSVEGIEHAPITIDRVNKAAAVQLVFEDALFHIVQHLIRTTRSTRLVMTGGTALNCVANMRLMERFDAPWYVRNLGIRDATLHLWVPPVPGDAGVAIGAAYHFACLAGAKPGESLQHAFYCGVPPTKKEIEDAIAKTPESAHGTRNISQSERNPPICSRTSFRWMASSASFRARPRPVRGRWAIVRFSPIRRIRICCRGLTSWSSFANRFGRWRRWRR